MCHIMLHRLLDCDNVFNQFSVSIRLNARSSKGIHYMNLPLHVTNWLLLDLHKNNHHFCTLANPSSICVTSFFPLTRRRKIKKKLLSRRRKIKKKLLSRRRKIKKKLLSRRRKIKKKLNFVKFQSI